MSEEERKEVFATIKRGESISLDAGKQASLDMMELVPTLADSKGRHDALEEHALYIGVGTRFMETVAPIVDNLTKELVRDAGFSKNEGTMITGIYLAKIFQGIEAGIRENK